jgi:D-sedoheptulose 7-phosphate isomerase
MNKFIDKFLEDVQGCVMKIPREEVSEALNILQATYERDGRIYIFGNGGSLALATHWVSDFNKTVFSHHLDEHSRRFQAIRVPTTDSEITAWANDVGYEMVFAGPLKNYLQDSDTVIAISSSGNSENVIKAVELAKSMNIPVIALTGFDGGKLNKLANAKLHIETNKGQYEVVEAVHAVVLHMIIKYFKDYFDHLAENEKTA